MKKRSFKDLAAWRLSMSLAANKAARLASATAMATLGGTLAIVGTNSCTPVA